MSPYKPQAGTDRSGEPAILFRFCTLTILIGGLGIVGCSLYPVYFPDGTLIEKSTHVREMLIIALVPAALFCLAYKFILQWQWDETRNPLKRKFWRHPINSYPSARGMKR